MPPRREFNKVCRVCADRAACFNFNVITCESCKSFFRRNCKYDPADFQCPFENNCEITAKTRKLCKRCRLVKCFKMGMTMVTRGSSDDHIDDDNTVEAVAKRPRFQGSWSSAKLDESPSMISTPDQDMNSEPLYNPQASSIASLPTTSSVQRIEYRCPITLHPLADFDRAKLNEIWEAAKCMPFTDDELQEMGVKKCIPCEKNPFSNLTVMHIVEYGYRHIIEMFKNIPAFMSLAYEDQLLLVKNGVPRVNFLFRLLNIDREQGIDRHFPFNPELNVRLPLSKHFDSDPEGASLLMGYLSNFDPDWQKDVTMILIMAFITLFHPRSDLADFNSVATQQAMYRDLLRRYLLAQNQSKVRAIYIADSVMIKLDELQKYRYLPIQSMLSITKTGAFLPLLTEVFNLQMKSGNGQSFK